MNPHIKIIGALLITGLVLYAALLVALWFFQERLLFHPETIPENAPIPAWIAQDDVQETRLEVPGATLSMLELRLKKPDGVVFFLHGNASNNWTWAGNLDFYRAINMDVVMLDYRGYGRSTGQISSQEQLHGDVRIAWDRISGRYEGKRRVFVGRSLGTGLAAELAASLPEVDQPDATILISPYSSMVATAAVHYPRVPSFVLRYPLRTDEVITRIRKDLVLLHGDQDVVIPMQQSLDLQRLVPQAKFVRIPGAGHSDLQEHPTYLNAVREAILSAGKASIR
jgi:pimeloyl-ACP methyl ester carboxylesterase